VRRLAFFALLFLAACAAVPPSRAPRPLEGKVWDVRAERFAAPEAVTAAVRAADYVFLGEKHDNPYHHALQAALIYAATATRPAAVAFEMVPASSQVTLDTYLAAKPAGAATLGDALGWRHTGWPAWAMYAQVFTAAVRAGDTLVAADVPKDWLRLARKGGLAALPVTWRAAAGLEVPLTAPQRAAMWKDIDEAHCGYAPTSAVDKLIDIQRLRDAHLALRMTEAPRAVLIAGGGHAREDFGAPMYVRLNRPRARTVAVVFVPVGPETSLADYRVAPFDYVWFTPDTDDEDPCVVYRDALRKMHAPR
jgi:uncharacterized iron-regulated protein